MSIGPETTRIARSVGLDGRRRGGDARSRRARRRGARSDEVAAVKYITFLTDFGLQDDFVGTCHGVIARHRTRRARDRHHARHPAAGHPAGRARPAQHDAVHAGRRPPRGRRSRRRRRSPRDRRSHLRRRLFVGPDNGLLMLAADELGVEAAHELTTPSATACRSVADVSRARRLRAGRRASRRRRRDRGARAARSSLDARADRRARARGRRVADLRDGRSASTASATSRRTCAAST